MKWKDYKVKIAIEAEVFGCLSVHKDIDNPDNFCITHVKTGYKLSSSWNVAIPTGRIGCKELCEDLISKIPDINSFFSAVAAGTATKSIKKKFGPKIYKIVGKYSHL